MSATEIIKEIKHLPPEERQKVVAYIRGLENAPEVSEDFKRVANEVFKTNDELFRKLAQ